MQTITLDFSDVPKEKRTALVSQVLERGWQLGPRAGVDRIEFIREASVETGATVTYPLDLESELAGIKQLFGAWWTDATIRRRHT